MTGVDAVGGGAPLPERKELEDTSFLTSLSHLGSFVLDSSDESRDKMKIQLGVKSEDRHAALDVSRMFQWTAHAMFTIGLILTPLFWPAGVGILITGAAIFVIGVGIGKWAPQQMEGGVKRRLTILEIIGLGTPLPIRAFISVAALPIQFLASKIAESFASEPTEEELGEAYARENAEAESLPPSQSASEVSEAEGVADALDYIPEEDANKAELITVMKDRLNTPEGRELIGNVIAEGGRKVYRFEDETRLVLTYDKSGNQPVMAQLFDNSDKPISQAYVVADVSKQGEGPRYDLGQVIGGEFASVKPRVEEVEEELVDSYDYIPVTDGHEALAVEIMQKWVNDRRDWEDLLKELRVGKSESYKTESGETITLTKNVDQHAIMVQLQPQSSKVPPSQSYAVRNVANEGQDPRYALCSEIDGQWIRVEAK